MRTITIFYKDGTNEQFTDVTESSIVETETKLTFVGKGPDQVEQEHTVPLGNGSDVRRYSIKGQSV